MEWEMKPQVYVSSVQNHHLWAVAAEVVRYKPLRKMHGGLKEPKAQVVATSHQRCRSRGGRAIQVITGWGDVKAKRVF